MVRLGGRGIGWHDALTFGVPPFCAVGSAAAGLIGKAQKPSRPCFCPPCLQAAVRSGAGRRPQDTWTQVRCCCRALWFWVCCALAHCGWRVRPVAQVLFSFHGPTCFNPSPGAAAVEDTWRPVATVHPSPVSILHPAYNPSVACRRCGWTTPGGRLRRPWPISRSGRCSCR